MSAESSPGVPLTINAGTGAYFMIQQLLKAPGLDKKELLECYELYFAALRGGHAGQALDIYGNAYLMDDVVEKYGSWDNRKGYKRWHLMEVA